MPTLETTLRDAIANAFVTRLDLGGTAPRISLQTSASTCVASIPLNYPSFSVTSGVATVRESAALTDSSCTGHADPVTKGLFITSSAQTIMTATVATSLAEINFAGGVIFGAGDSVTITDLVVSVAAS